jgi:hypothetical protein
MLQVVPVNLNVTLPSDWITMVAMQPHIHLTTPEPFKWPDDKKEEQIAGIRRTLEIAREKQAHFTLFPEYSIPGLEGIDAINGIIADGSWPNNTIVIGGVDGLNKAEYEYLCQQPNIECPDNNKHNCVGQSEWINCSVTWVKDDNGTIKMYIQPKICPAWPEKNINWATMFCGKAISVFEAKYNNGAPFLFVSIICFDWIGKINDRTKVVDNFMETFNNICETRKDLHWIFILQENDEPNHVLFIQKTSEFLTQRTNYAKINRSKSAIVFVNNSGRTMNGSTDINRALTSCVFPGDICFNIEGSPPTYSFASEKFRGTTINRCKDTVFREQRPCIHLFKIRIAEFLDITQISRCHPIEYAEVHPLIEDMISPCFPGQPVPASVKWINDKLDAIQSLANRYNQASLQHLATLSHNNTVAKLRQLPADKQQNNIHYATAYHGNDKNWTNVDRWNGNESDSLEHLLHAITICGITDNAIDLANSKLHARITIDAKPYEVIAIKGHGHDDCARHFIKECHTKINHPILLISRDIDNNEFTQRFAQNITKGNPPVGVTDIKFANQAYGVIQKGYRELLDVFKSSEDESHLKEGLRRYVA